MKLSLVTFLLTLVSCLFTSCNTNNNVLCTTEFVSVVVTVHGNVLDDYFTIQNSTGDTIRYNTLTTNGSRVYSIVTDSDIHKFKHEVETFTFKGFIHDSLVVNEQYVIKADQCHINYLSGKTEINL